MTGYDLIIEFPDQSKSFALGFEAGGMWQRMKNRESEIGQTIHSENLDLITAMATRQHYEVVRVSNASAHLSGVKGDSGWVDLLLRKYQ